MNRTYRPKKYTVSRAIAAASVLALLFTFLPVGSTWAWFTQSRSSGVSPIQAASFRVIPTITPYVHNTTAAPLSAEEAAPQVTAIAPDEDGLYNLTPGVYNVALRRDPDSTASTGYCTIRSASGLNVHTITLEETVNFVLEVKPVDENDLTVADQLMITPSWGSYEKNGVSLLSLTEELCVTDGMILNTLGEVLTEVPVPETPPAYTAVSEHAIPLYFQNDYPDNRYGAGTIASDGCGMASLAMVANYLTGYQYDLPALARWFGGTAENNIARFETGATTLGLSFQRVENIDIATEALLAGKIVVMMMDGFTSENPFTDSQHFIVVRGITTENRYLVNDSNRPNYDKWELKTGFEKGFSRATMVAGYSGAWVFDTELPEDFVPYVKNEPAPQDNYPGVELTDAEVELLARLIWAEARGECAEGQQAVAEVVLNRLVSGKFTDSIAGIIIPSQFSGCETMEEAELWQAQYDAIDAARYGIPVLEKDVFYFARHALTSQVFATIGNHIFCKDELVPEETEPETTEPEETEPETTEPDETVPETTEPDETVPETTEPDETVPETTEPDETVPETTAPDETVPETTAPDETIPETTAPQETEPETTAPDKTITETTAPEETKPRATAPDETIPVTTEPKEQGQPEKAPEMPKFYQSDYPNTPYGDSTIGEDGSAIVSLAMVASYITEHRYTPDKLAAWFAEAGEDDISRLESAAETLKLPWKAAKDTSAAAQGAARGKILILRLENTEKTPSAFTDSVHFLVVRGVTEDGKYLLSDPSKDNTQKAGLAEGFQTGFAPEDVLSACTHAWIFDPNGLGEDFVPYTK